MVQYKIFQGNDYIQITVNLFNQKVLPSSNEKQKYRKDLTIKIHTMKQNMLKSACDIVRKFSTSAADIDYEN
jgi:hypothetical protein|tara:strand:- start:23784 stop:23999 length:216 start_codon:yes stop_codon:yes gene_type:complete